MSIKATCACIYAILDGSTKNAEFTADSVFDFDNPKLFPGVEPKVLNAREAWDDKEAYYTRRDKLA